MTYLLEALLVCNLVILSPIYFNCKCDQQAKSSEQVRLKDSDKKLLNAAADGQTELVTMLVKEGANINAIDEHRMSPLFLATANSHLETVVRLLELGANANVATGYPSLLVAIGHKDIDIVKALLRYGANSNVEGYTSMSGSQSPVSLAISLHSIEILKMLVSAGGKINPKPVKDTTPLINAIYQEDEEVIIFLLDSKADTNAKTTIGITPLLAAVEIGNERIVKLLIKYGANVATRNKSGETPEQVAEKHGFISIALYLKNSRSSRPRKIENKDPRK